MGKELDEETKKKLRSLRDVWAHGMTGEVKAWRQANELRVLEEDGAGGLVPRKSPR